jgi:uncharacterized protein YggE
MQNAYAKANDFATGGHESIGSIESINAVESPYYPIYYSPLRFAANFANGVPIQPGSQNTNVQVTVTYSLN